MSIVTDSKVSKLIKEKEIIIDPYFSRFQGPNCYHCHLGSTFLRLKSNLPKDFVINPLETNPNEYLEKIIVKESYTMLPGEFVLAETFEYFGTNESYVIRLLNSSSLARVGISQAALGMINAGCGKKVPVRLTLELINNSAYPIKLTPTQVQQNSEILWGTEVLKVSVEKLESPASIAYDDWKFGVYSKDKEVAASKMVNRFNGETLILDKSSEVNRIQK